MAKKTAFQREQVLLALINVICQKMEQIAEAINDPDLGDDVRQTIQDIRREVLEIVED